MAYYVIVRQTLDWERATSDDLLDDFARETARTWKRTFNDSYSYFTCRARIKAIARESLELLAGDVQVHDAATFPFLALQPDDVVLPCDDDDWYHPEVIEQVAAASPLRSGLLMWPDAVYGYHRERFHLERPYFRPLDEPAVSGPVKTNNYAFSGRLAQEHHAVWGHGSIVRYVQETRPAFDRIDRPLSLVNRHPCSYTVWKYALRGIRPADGADALRRLIARYTSLAVGDIQPEFRWALPYIERMHELFRGVSCKGSSR